MAGGQPGQQGSLTPALCWLALAACPASWSLAFAAALDLDLHPLYQSSLEEFGRTLLDRRSRRTQGQAGQADAQEQELPFRILSAADIANLPARFQDISTQWLPRWKLASRGRRPRPRDLSAAIERAALPPRIRGALHRLHQEARQRGGQDGAEVQRDIGYMLLHKKGKRLPEEATLEDDEEMEDAEFGDEDEELDVLDEDSAEEEIAEAQQHDPFWHHPCGKSVNLLVRRAAEESPRAATRHLNKALERVWQQLNMTVLHYKLQRFDKLYYKVRIGVGEHQYIPNWVPDKHALRDIQTEGVHSNEELARQLTRMHTQLQKFSVAVEQIAEDEQDDHERRAALFKTQSYIKMLLCEVEWALLSLAIPLPEHIPRDIMSATERDLSDTTGREVRDWGVLLRYRDFLHGWADIVARARAGHAT